MNTDSPKPTLSVQVVACVTPDFAARIDELAASWAPPLKRGTMARLALERGMAELEADRRKTGRGGRI